MNNAKGNPADIDHDHALGALFRGFVLVADAGAGLTADDVAHWHQWARQSQQVGEAEYSLFTEAEQQFEALWKQYVAQGDRPDLETTASALKTLFAHWPDLKRIWLQLLDAIAPEQPSTLARLVGRKTPTARLQARRALAQALQSAAANHAPTTPASDRVKPAPSTPQQNTTAVIPDTGLLMPQRRRKQLKLRCIDVIQETHDVRTFVWQEVEPALFAFLPGQFITLALLVEAGKTLRRSYTISSSPSRPHTFSTTIKRIVNGRGGSNWIFEHIKPGFECKATGPHGEFSCGTQPLNLKLLLIGAGSGITPIMSMLRWLADTHQPVDLVVINNVRSPEDIIFKHELDYLASRLGKRMRLAIVPSRIQPGQHWIGPTGRFNAQLLHALVDDLAERDVYTCGPEPFMAEVYRTLIAEGLPEQRYHQESFAGDTPVSTKSGNTFAPSPQSDTSQVQTPVATNTKPNRDSKAALKQPATKTEAATVFFAQSNKTLTAQPDQELLELAEEHGVDIPASCYAGSCGTCKVKKISGEVEMDEQDALSADEIAEGWVLCCVGKPKSTKVQLDA